MKLIPRLRKRRLLFPALFYLALAVFSTRIPLLNYIGYEFSVVIAFAATFLAGFHAIRAAKEVSMADVEESRPAQDSVVSAFRGSLRGHLLLLIIPLFVMGVNAFFVRNCSLLEGLGFFLLIPVVTVVFSSSLGFFCAVHYRWSKTLFALSFLATIAYALALGYFTPAIFSYNFFYGFFPGLTYDEALGMTSSLVLFRVFTLFLSAGLVWMAVLMIGRTGVNDKTSIKGIALAGMMVRGKSMFITASFVVVMILAWWWRCELGFESTSHFIQETLGNRVETRNFIIFYSKDSYADDEMQRIGAEHEFRLKQITDEFAIPYNGGPEAHEPRAQKIESYVYPSSEIKQRLMGAGTTNIAKPWSGQIHITQQSLGGTLKHELVHVVAAKFGVPVLKASLSTGLVEGLAEAIDWNFGNRTLHQYSAAMQKAGVAPSLRALMLFTGFASQSSSISYVLAGSFCRYLVDQYGIRSMTLLYRTNDYSNLYKKSLDELIAEWQRFLASLPVTENDLAAIDIFFRRPAIFKKVCARTIANKNADARTHLARKEYDGALALFSDAYNQARSYESLSGMLVSALRLGRYDVVISSFDSILSMDSRPRQFLPLYVNVGDAFWATGDTAKALRVFRQVESVDFSESYTEAAILRRLAIRDTTREWRQFFLSDHDDTARVLMLRGSADAPPPPLSKYLLMKTLVRLRRYDEARSVALSFTFARTVNTLEALRLRSLGEILLRLKRFEDAKAQFWRSLNYQSNEHTRDQVNDRVDRCEWMKKAGQ